MDFSIHINATNPAELEKYLVAIKSVDAQEILTPDEPKPAMATTLPPAGMYFPGSAPLNPQPFFQQPGYPQQPPMQQYQQQYQQPGNQAPQPPLQQYQQQYQQPQAPQQPPQQYQPPLQQAPAGAPIVAPDYTHEQLGRAVAAFADKAKGNMEKAQACLQAQGVQAVQQLDTPAKRGAFAVALRQIGVQI